LYSSSKDVAIALVFGANPVIGAQLAFLADHDFGITFERKQQAVKHVTTEAHRQYSGASNEPGWKHTRFGVRSTTL
jgi:hypothetical protein